MDDQNASTTIDDSALDRLGRILWIGTALGGVALLMANWTGLIAAFGIGALIFFAAFSSGAFLGFLFGVPRVLSSAELQDAAPASAAPVTGQALAVAGKAPPDPAARNGEASPGKLRLLRSNTNLERISDWLTTMLVGAGLVELHNINDALFRFRQLLEESARVFPVVGVGKTAGALPLIGPVVLILGVTCGFLFMYLNTRLVLVRLFHAIERLISGGDQLGPETDRAVRAIARENQAPDSIAKQQLDSTRRLTIQDALGVMFELLYKSDPDRVIRLGGQLSATAAVNRPDYWFYLAAAYGQKLHRLDRESDEWLSNRDNALDCARRTVNLDASYRARLWVISNPDGYDNDLAPLRDDPEFLRIVGQH